MNWIGLLQWPAMLVNLLAAWLVASKRRARRRWGFGLFILSNILWIAWAWHTESYALVALQVGLFVMNTRGQQQNAGTEANDASDDKGSQPHRALEVRGLVDTLTRSNR